MVWMYLFVTNTCLLGIGGMLYAVSSAQREPLWVYPFWLTEMMVSYYWFALVYVGLKNILNKDATVSELQRYLFHRVVNLFPIHVLFAWVVSLWVLPQWIDLSFSKRLLIAYPGTFGIILLLPLLLFIVLFYRGQKYEQKERIRPKKIRAWAMRNPSAQRFLALFPECKIYVYDHTVKNLVATCVFLYRAPRPERAGLMEDVLLEIPVNMESKKPVEENIQSMRYLFESGDEQCAILNLCENQSFEDYDLYKRLSEEILHRFDGQMKRFPSLEVIPFPLAVRGVPYKIL